MKSCICLLQYVVKVLVMATIVSGCGGNEGNQDSEEPASPIPEEVPPLEAEIRLQYEGIKGIFDPSLEYDSNTNRIYMSLSSVGISQAWPIETGMTVETRLARSDDGGRTWVDPNLDLNLNPDVTLDVSEFPSQAGTWRSEVSTLFFDSRNGKWGLLWLRYLVIGQERRFDHSWFSLKQASSPENLAQASEVKLMGAAGYDPRNDVLGGATGSPVGGAPKIMVNQKFAPLANCVVLSEPGVLVVGNDLLLAFNCHELPAVNTRIVLLRHRCVLENCDYEDGDQWTYVNTLAQDSDAVRMGYKSWTAADLYELDGQVQLLLTPTLEDSVTDGYNGCFIFRFADLEQGQLQKELGDLVVSTEVVGDPELFRGACAYHQKLEGGGVLLSQAYLGEDRIFRMLRSFVDPQP